MSEPLATGYTGNTRCFFFLFLPGTAVSFLASGSSPGRPVGRLWMRTGRRREICGPSPAIRRRFRRRQPGRLRAED